MKTTEESAVRERQAAEPQFAAFVAIDWADQEHVWCLQVAGSEQSEKGTVKNTPEAVEAWIAQLCQRFPTASIAVAIEKCRGRLILLLSKYTQLYLYPIPPQAAANFRKALHPSGATDDGRDAAALLEMLCRHRSRLRRWSPDTEQTRMVQNLVEERRRLVDDKTRLINCMTDKLKIYFPQMLDWFERLDSDLVCTLLERWPTLPQLQQVGASRLRTFFRKHHCRKNELIESRIQAIGQAVPALADEAVIQPQAFAVRRMAKMLREAIAGVQEADRLIEQAASAHPDFFLFDNLPGAGAVMAPRLLAAFGSQRERYNHASEMQSFSGIAPVREQSGRTAWTHFRSGCPKFLRQTFHEWAGHSLPRCAWAQAYYQQQLARGKSHHTAVRALAFKWIRILFRCWKDRVPYDETRYLESRSKRRRPLAAGTAL